MASNLPASQTSESGVGGQTGGRSVSTSDGQYIAPVIAVMNADASGTYGVLQRAKVTITNIDETFSYILSAQQSANLMNLFRVADADLSGDNNKLDSSANVAVSLNLAEGSEDANNFRKMIREALMAALSSAPTLKVNGGTTPANEAPEAYLEYQAYKDALNALKYDTLADMLGADDFTSFKMRLDPSGGAISLVEKLTDADDVIRKTLYTQLPETNTEEYLAASGGALLPNGVFAAENVKEIEFLPFVVGDKVVFVFDVTVGKATAGTGEYAGTLTPLITEGPVITRVNGDGALKPSNDDATSTGVGGLGAGALVNEALPGSQYVTDAAGGAASLLFSAPTRRRIALALMISRRAGEFGEGHVDPSGAVQTDYKKGLIMSFKPAGSAQENIKIDPKGTSYALMLAAGMLNNATSIKADAGPVTAIVGKAILSDAGIFVDDVSYGMDISQGAVSDGSNNVVVTGCEALVGADISGIYGRFAFIPSTVAGERANEFTVSRVGLTGNTWQLEINAMKAGLSKGVLYYVENNGAAPLELPVSVTTTWV